MVGGGSGGGVAMAQSWALVGQDFWTGLGEDFKSGVKFRQFALGAKAGEAGWSGQVGWLKAGIWLGGVSCLGPGCLILQL